MPRWLILAHGIDALNERLGRALSWLTLLMVLVMAAVVLLRHLGLGRLWLAESVTWMHAIVFLLGAAYTLKHGAQVRVDILHQRFGPRGRAAVEIAGVLLLLWPFCAFLLWTSADYVLQSWRVFEGSQQTGGLPGLFLLKTGIWLFAGLLALQGLAALLHAAAQWTAREPPPELAAEDAADAPHHLSHETTLTQRRGGA
jgi:TRAP-type mannitol/chloroaromatic compound transport system permease small subunit